MYAVPLMVIFVAFALYCATWISTDVTSLGTVKVNEPVLLLVPIFSALFPIASVAGPKILVALVRARV